EEDEHVGHHLLLHFYLRVRGGRLGRREHFLLYQKQSDQNCWQQVEIWTKQPRDNRNVLAPMEEANRGPVGSSEVVNPKKRTLTQIDGARHPLAEANKYGHLNEHRKAARDRADLMLAPQFHLRTAKFLFVV